MIPLILRDYSRGTVTPIKGTVSTRGNIPTYYRSACFSNVEGCACVLQAYGPLPAVAAKRHANPLMKMLTSLLRPTSSAGRTLTPTRSPNETLNTKPSTLHTKHAETLNTQPLDPNLIHVPSTPSKTPKSEKAQKR